MIGDRDGVESVISFTDDEQSIWSLGGSGSRWEPEESMPPANSTNSPKVPLRRGSVVADPSTAIGLPKLPRRRRTMIRTGSNDSGSIGRYSKDASLSPSRVSGRNNSPPRFPCRKRSQEGVPLAKFKDLVKVHSRRNMIKQHSVQRDIVNIQGDIVKQQPIQLDLVKHHSVPRNLVKQQSARQVDSPNQKMATAA